MRGFRVVRSMAAVMAVVVLGGCAAVQSAGFSQAGQSTDGGPTASVNASSGYPCAVTTVAESIPEQGIKFGVNLDWGSETLAQFADKLGQRPDVAVSFAVFPMDGTTVTNVVAAADQVRMNGGTLLLTLEPHRGLAAVTDRVAEDLAELLRPINDSGVPVIVRFAHEMNGSWYEWGQKPTEYVAAFRRVAAALRDGAPASGMMWAPNYAGGYPFAGGAQEAHPGDIGFDELDTDRDGALTAVDDPYSPYYPGDDAVDWVGMSLYHWGSTYPWGENELPEPGKFVDQLTGNYYGLGGDDRAAPDFYQVYGVEHDKPVAIPETAAFFTVTDSTTLADEIAIKRAWWRQAVSEDTAERFPRLHMVNWFEWNKEESETGGVVDWSITRTPDILDAFTGEIPESFHFAEPPTACSKG